MRKIANFIAFAAASGVCALMMYISYRSSKETLLYNASFLGVMLIIILFSLVTGIRKMVITKKEMERATGSVEFLSNHKDADENENCFHIEPFKKKYDEYNECAKRTKGAVPVSCYISEELVSLFARVETMELIPDILTSLGILGTFIGLVWGLHNFDPTTYESMAGSITSLIDGIKVAFITSIFGIALSVMFSFLLKRTEDSMFESHINFLNAHDKFAGNDTRTLVLNKMAVNQKKQTEAVSEAIDVMPEMIAESVAKQLKPVTEDLSETMHQFLNIVTLNQQELMETVSKSVAKSVSGEMVSDIEKLERSMSEINKAQSEYIKTMQEATKFYKENVGEETEKIKRQAEEDDVKRKEATRLIYKQQKMIIDFMEKSSETLDRMSELSNDNAEITKRLHEMLDETDESRNDTENEDEDSLYQEFEIEQDGGHDEETEE